MTASPEYRWQAVGRRKTSVARVYLTPGTGKWDVNGRTLGDYFPRPSLVQHIQQSFTATDTLGAFDVKAHVDGGGQTGPAGALRLGIARALVSADEQHRQAAAAGSDRIRGWSSASRTRRPEAVPVLEALDGASGISHIAGFRPGCPAARDLAGS
jgi:small subunit ribosomal protein S9